ncbi:hypothetical protein [Ruminococcus sp.]|uniref:hypothetical protein n=1 Tax=Ruminococcus sp. TaxID=41978 RepID=UPI0025905CDA|nr:hypothetical protein [Ruminococcus sp.]MCR5020051.1 hypothetical protein [Ruminococcus sp.]
MNLKDISKKVNISLNSKTEKNIMAASISTALAILTISNKKKKGKPNFFQRIGKYYSSIDKLLVMTVAKTIEAEETRRAAEREFTEKKLRDLKIIDAEPLDLSDLEEEVHD